MEKKGRCYRSREQWLEVLEQQARSGLSQTAFCQQQGITLSAFHNAKSRLGSKALCPRPSRPLSMYADEPALVPASTNWDVERSLGEGVVLRVRRAWGQV